MTNYFEAWELEIDSDRVVEVYNQLVHFTGDKEINTYSKTHYLLSSLLEVLEYIVGNEHENPIDNLFGKD